MTGGVLPLIFAKSSFESIQTFENNKNPVKDFSVGGISVVYVVVVVVVVVVVQW